MKASNLMNHLAIGNLDSSSKINDESQGVGLELSSIASGDSEYSPKRKDIGGQILNTPGLAPHSRQDDVLSFDQDNRNLGKDEVDKTKIENIFPSA